MSNLTIGIIVTCLMLVMLFLGFPLSITLLSTSALGLWWMGGYVTIYNQFSAGLLAQSASYSFAVVPLFLAVGILAGETGIASGAYTSARKWVGRFRGGLLYTTIGANVIFGACNGLPAAGNVVFCKIAYPELNKYGYDSGTSLACICASGALSALIPPSMSIMMFCILAEVSIGDALLAGTAGGILLAVVLCVTVYVVSRINPKKIPGASEDDKNVTWKERFTSLRLLIPILLLFALIVGGSFMGWFPATVGGAIAVVAILIYALCTRNSIKSIAHGLWQGAHDFAGLYLMVLGGQMFSRFITLSGITSALVDVISGLAVPAIVIFAIVVVFYVICGCLMDCMSILIITIPVVFPLLESVGYDPFVICVALVFLANLGGITPPVGMSVFQCASVTGENSRVIFRGMIPFIIAFFVCVFAIAIFPNLILWLPHLLS